MSGVRPCARKDTWSAPSFTTQGQINKIFRARGCAAELRRGHGLALPYRDLLGGVGLLLLSRGSRVMDPRHRPAVRARARRLRADRIDAEARRDRHAPARARGAVLAAVPARAR